MTHYEISQPIPDSIRREIKTKGGLGEILKKTPSLEEIESQSKIFKAISDPLRLRILHILRQQGMCVCLIKVITDEADTKLSYHFSILKDAGLIQGDYEKTWIIYRLTKLGESYLESCSD